jgi:hypothetical protein
MAFYEDDFERTDGGIVHISSTNQEWEKPVGAEEQSIYDYYSIGVKQPSNIIELNTHIPIISEQEVEYLFNSWYEQQPQTYYESDSYIAIKQRLIDGNQIQWLWGSYDNGGACYYAIAPNTIQFRTVSGFYRTGVVDENNVFCYNTATMNMTMDEAKAIRFSIDEDQVDNISETFFPLKLYLGGDTFRGAVFKYAIKYPASGLEYGYYGEDVLPTNFNYITGQCGTFLDFPVDIPIIDDLPKFIFRTNKVGYCWDVNFPGGELVSGSFFGLSEIDSEGNPFLPGDYSMTAGGWGDFPSRSDSIDTTNPENFGVDVINSGFLTLYNPTSEEIINFNKFLFSDLTDGMINQLRKLTTEPLQYLIFMAMCHFEPVSFSREEISFTGIGSGVTAKKISKQYKQINCGSVTIPEASKSFLDYGGFSKVSIFLPYCGIQQLNIDDVMGATVKVVYNIDQLTGACLAQVKCTRNKRNGSDTQIDSVLYTFNGNCYETIPIFASDWRSAINAITGLVGGIASAAVTKDVGGLIGSMTNAITSEKVKVNRSGSPSASFGYMDNQRPYFILERPVQNIPTNYGKLQGYTSNLYRGIGYLKGFTIVYDDTLWTQKINCSKEEADEIRRIMAGGVFL